MEAIGDEIAQIQTALDQATQRQLSLLRDFDEGSGWAISGARSCAAWLSWRTGLSLGPARDRVRVGHKLGGLPLIDAAFASGELSYTKVRALTRVADADSEELLLEQARCDAGVVPVLEDDAGRVIDVGRKTRTIPSALRRAIALRDGGCRFPGCENQIVDAHHIEHWINGGPTSRENLTSLCRPHHRLVHEGGATVEVAGDRFEFRDHRGEVIRAVPERPAAAPLATDHIDPFCGCATNTDPTPVDWPYLVGVVTSALCWAGR